MTRARKSDTLKKFAKSWLGKHNSLESYDLPDNQAYKFEDTY